MNEYELTLVLDPTLKKNDKDEVQTKVESVIKLLEGKITKFEDQGIKDLAYEINKNRHAIYLFFLLKGDKNFEKIIHEQIKLDKRVWRYLIIKTN